MEERHRNLLIKQNPWWQDKEIKLPEFERDMLGTLQEYVKYRQIIALVGLRRVGKTVIMKQIINKLDASRNNVCYISFDDIDFQKYAVAQDLIDYFLEFSDKGKRRFLFLDEIQKLEHWEDLLKTYYDTEDNLKIFVSGSSSLELKSNKETLAGRILTFHLPVLGFGEFARYFGMDSAISSKDLFREYDLKFAAKKEKYNSLFEIYLLKGAFPELLDIDDEDFIKKYIKESVIEKTIVDIARAAKEDEKIIYELLRLLSNSNASLFEIENLSNILKVNRNLVSRYVSLIEKSFLIKVSYNFTSSVAKQVRASKKQYSAHSSIVIAMLDYPFGITKMPIVGHLVEAVVANNVENSAFWRSPEKDEVDIISKEKEVIVPIEVKYQQDITKDDLRPLLKFSKRFNAERGVIVTRNLLEKQRIGSMEILLVPAWLFLLCRD